MKVFRMKYFEVIPKWFQLFRVGPWVGRCILKTPWIVIMWKTN